MANVNTVRYIITRSLCKKNVYAGIIHKRLKCDLQIIRSGLIGPSVCDREHVTESIEFISCSVVRNRDSNRSSILKSYLQHPNKNCTFKQNDITNRMFPTKSNLLALTKLPLNFRICAFHSRCESGNVFAKKCEDGGSKTDEILTDQAKADVRSFNAVEQTLGKIEPTRMRIVYTCKVCGSKNTNTFSKSSYTHGVVIVTCQGCKNNHLIADNLGWFQHIGKR